MVAEVKTSGPAAPRCRHCGGPWTSNRPRGLCWTCYYAPGVRERYPSTSPYARRGVGNLTGRRPLPADPTGAVPGSPEKVAAMEARAARGEQLFHPADATHEEGR